MEGQNPLCLQWHGEGAAAFATPMHFREEFMFLSSFSVREGSVIKWEPYRKVGILGFNPVGIRYSYN